MSYEKCTFRTCCLKERLINDLCGIFKRLYILVTGHQIQGRYEHLYKLWSSFKTEISSASIKTTIFLHISYTFNEVVNSLMIISQHTTLTSCQAALLTALQILIISSSPSLASWALDSAVTQGLPLV